MSSVTSADGTTIGYTRTGAGPPLVFVDGALSERSSGPSGPLAAALAADFTVYTYDRRGRGESGDTPPYAVAREIEDLAAILDVAGTEVRVVGASSGSALVIEAVAAGLPVDRAVLHEPPYTIEGGEREAAEQARRIVDLLAENKRAEAVGTFLGLTPDDLDGMRQAPFWPALEAVAHTLAYDLAIVGDGVPADRCAAMRTPTLVVRGELSEATIVAAAELVAAAIPGARSAVLRGQDHAAEPGSFAPVITEFCVGGT